METINGSVALVTGASSRIGEGIAKMLADEGVKVALVARCQNELERVAKEINQKGGTALGASADLRDEGALRAAVEQTQNALGPIDILVNCGRRSTWLLRQGQCGESPVQDRNTPHMFYVENWLNKIG